MQRNTIAYLAVTVLGVLPLISPNYRATFKRFDFIIVMIRILIADDRKTIHWLLESFFAERQNIDLVGTADNGKTAVELTNQLLPDIVLINLFMPIINGLSATKLIAKSHQQTKIIIFSSQENRQFVARAIMAGANGYLLKKSAIKNLTTALQTVSEGKYYLDPQLATSNVLHRELPTITQDSSLDNLTYALAKEIIVAWRFQTSDRHLSTAKLIASLGLPVDRVVGAISPIIFELEKSSQSTSFFKKLSIPLNLLQTSIWTRKNINSNYMFGQLRESEVEIKDWFERNLLVDEWSNNVSQPHLKVKNVRTKIFTEFEANIAILWQHAGSRVTFEWLQELDSSLQAIKVDYQDRDREQIQKETSAWSAFSILSNELATSKKKAGDIRNWQAAWKALLFAYKFKLYALLYSYASERLIIELIQRVKAYKNTVMQTDNLLADLQSKFARNTHTKIDLTFLPFDFTNSIEPIQLREELESFIGCSLNQWGKTDSIDDRLLQEWIIARIQPIANQFYIQDYPTVIVSSDDCQI